MSELNAKAVDQVIDQPDGDTVALPASEVVRLRSLDKQLAALENDVKSNTIASALTEAFRGFDLLPGVAGQLAKLWRDDFAAKRIDGQWVAQGPAGETVAEIVKARLGGAEYLHFLKATSRGGTGSNGMNPLPTGGQAQGQAPSYLEQVSANWNAQRANGRGRGLSSSNRQ